MFFKTSFQFLDALCSALLLFVRNHISLACNGQGVIPLACNGQGVIPLACNGQGVLPLACNRKIKLTVAPAIILQPLRNAFHWLAHRWRSARRFVVWGTPDNGQGAIENRAANYLSPSIWLVIIRPNPIDVVMTLEGLSQTKDCAISISDRVTNCHNKWQNISSTCIRSCIDTLWEEYSENSEKRNLYSTNKELRGSKTMRISARFASLEIWRLQLQRLQPSASAPDNVSNFL